MKYNEKNKIAEEIFRNYYVPLYPKNKLISSMTLIEQSIYAHTCVIVSLTINTIKNNKER